MLGKNDIIAIIMRLIYEKLAKDYLQSLHSKLRNFAVEPDFLSMWVLDEDDNKSIFELFIAAQEAGVKDLALEIGPETAKKINTEWLSKELAALGEASSTPGKGSLELHVRFKSAAEKDKAKSSAQPSAPAAKPGSRRKPGLRVDPKLLRSKPSKDGNGRFKARTKTSAPGQIHPAYESAMRQAQSHIACEGDLPAPGAGCLAVTINQDGAQLGAVVDAQALVLEARHKNAGGTLRALLDQLCGFMTGRPLQEAHDHAIIRLEAKLRDPAIPRPVSGLVTPRNADPIFEAPEKMVRALFREYLARSGRKPEANFWDDSAKPAWAALSPENRLERARAAVHEGCSRLGIPTEGIEILEILGGVRLVLAHSPATSSTSFGAQMMRLESLIKKALDPRIELQLESLEDRNRRAERTARSHKLI